MKKSLFILGLFAVAGSANAVILYTGGTITENFDGLISTGTTTGMFSSTAGVQTAITGTTFDGAKIGGTGTTNMNLIANDGSSNTGAIHSLGQVGSGERALGMLASGTNIAGVGVEIRNVTGLSLTSMTVSFTQENWRTSSTAVNTMVAAWGRTGGGMTSSDYLTNANMAAVNPLDLVGPPFVTTNGAIDGNNALNQVAKTHTFTFTTPLAAGDSVFIRWSDFNDGGNDANIALDQFSVTATAVPEPATMAALGLGVAALLRRRKK